MCICAHICVSCVCLSIHTDTDTDTHTDTHTHTHTHTHTQDIIKNQGGTDNPWEQVGWADMVFWQRMCWAELGWTQRAWDLDSQPNPATDDMEFAKLAPMQVIPRSQRQHFVSKTPPFFSHKTQRSPSSTMAQAPVACILLGNEVAQ
jgi:hypothetical protein